MARETITVKLAESGGHPRSQFQQRRELDRICASLVEDGLATAATVNVVFPGSANPAMATLFTIDLEPTRRGVEQSLRRLQALQGVEFVHSAATRRPLAIAPAR